MHPLVQLSLKLVCGAFVQSATSAYADIRVSHKIWPLSANEVWAPIRQG